jgi:hypothetical protein
VFERAVNNFCGRFIDRGVGLAVADSHLPAASFTTSGEVDILNAKPRPAFRVEVADLSRGLVASVEE